MDPITIALLAASLGYSIYSSNEQQKAAAEAARSGETSRLKNQSNLIASQYKKRRSSETLLGQGSTASQAISDRGDILTSTPQTRSILGG